MPQVQFATLDSHRGRREGVGGRVLKGCVYPVLNWSHFCFILVLERKHLSNWIEPIATGFSCTVKELD
ncbi:MAG: hypothetical protein C5S47_07255 [Candidatus Methanogasteraceae archaeon]|nr:MAG: hypothetical protein C5S47_07255 [ANME-2 cluster archaeon]